MLKSERMGHEIPGMAGVYGHVMPEWRDRLRTQLQELWEASLHERARLSPHSAVGLVDKLLAARGALSGAKVGPNGTFGTPWGASSLSTRPTAEWGLSRARS